MKRVLIFVIAISISLISFGCGIDKDNTLNHIDSDLEEEGEINYEIDQVLLSKSFQSIEPSVEVITKSNKLKVLASLGLTESSGVDVNKVIKRGNEIDIHVSSIYDETNLQLAVPQVILEFKKLKLRKIEDIKFNIINDDYRPLKIKFGVNEVLNKIQSHFKISSVGSPTVNLTRLNDSILWNISYTNIFDRDNSQIPLINLSTLIDANSGDIIESKKTFISSSIDDGNILSYVSNNFILYKKSEVDNNTNKVKEQLWSYDIANKQKEMIFSSNFKISSAQYSPELSYVSVIEVNDNDTELYIIPREDKRAYRISFEDKFDPKIMRWKDDNNIYLIENKENESIVYNYEVKDNKSDKIGKINKVIENLVIMKNTFLIVENSEDKYNKRISTTLDWKEFRFRDDGFNPQFIDADTIGYLKKDEKVDINSLFVYNIKSDKTIDKIEENVSTFQIVSDNALTYVKKNNTHNDFTLSKYLLDSKEKTDITHLIGDRIFHDTRRDYIYVNIVLPFENDKSELIYSIDLSKIN